LSRLGIRKDENKNESKKNFRNYFIAGIIISGLGAAVVQYFEDKQNEQREDANNVILNENLKLVDSVLVQIKGIEKFQKKNTFSLAEMKFGYSIEYPINEVEVEKLQLNNLKGKYFSYNEIDSIFNTAFEKKLDEIIIENDFFIFLAYPQKSYNMDSIHIMFLKAFNMSTCYYHFGNNSLIGRYLVSDCIIQGYMPHLKYESFFDFWGSTIELETHYDILDKNIFKKPRLIYGVEFYFKDNRDFNFLIPSFLFKKTVPSSKIIGNNIKERLCYKLNLDQNMQNKLEQFEYSNKNVPGFYNVYDRIKK